MFDNFSEVMGFEVNGRSTRLMLAGLHRDFVRDVSNRTGGVRRVRPEVTHPRMTSSVTCCQTRTDKLRNSIDKYSLISEYSTPF